MPFPRLLLLLGAWFVWPAAIIGLLFTLDISQLELVAALAVLPAAAVTVTRWDRAPGRRVHLSRWPGLLIVLVAMSASLFFTALLSRYWDYFHLDTPGTGAALIGLVLPASFLILTAVALVSRRREPREQPSPTRSATRPLLAMVLAVVLMFTLELVQSAEARSGEGEGAGDLTPFFASLLR